MEKQIKRSANWQQNEKDLLSKLALDKLEIIEDARIDTNTNKKKREAWNAIHQLFNQVSAYNRTLEQIQNQWRKTKSMAKTNNSAFIKQSKQTGGGPAPKPLSSVEEELVSRIPKHFEVDINLYDSNSQIDETTSKNIHLSSLNETVKPDDEIFFIVDDTPVEVTKRAVKTDDEILFHVDDNPTMETKRAVSFKRKGSIKCQCEADKENVKRIKLLDLSIKQKELEIKCLEEEHTLRIEKMKIEIANLKKNSF